jgi:hypothetical protein
MSQVSPASVVRPKATPPPAAQSRIGCRNPDQQRARLRCCPRLTPRIRQRSGSSQGTISRLTAMTISERGTPTLTKSPNA